MARHRISSSHHGPALRFAFFSFVWICSLPSISLAYRPGDIVPMSKAGQYHASRTDWHDVIGRHCPIFAVNKEALLPIQKPTGYTGADPYKISFQVGHEKFYVPWLYVINRKSTEVPLIDFHLRYSGSDLHGVTAKVIDMPHHSIYESMTSSFPSENVSAFSSAVWNLNQYRVPSRHTQAFLGSAKLAKVCACQIHMGGAVGDRRCWGFLCIVWIRFSCIFHSGDLCLAIIQGETNKVREGKCRRKQYAWRNSKGRMIFL